MKMTLSIMAAALMAVSTTAIAQDTRELVLTTKLKDTDGDGFVKLTTKAIAPFARNETIRFCPTRKPFTYVAAASTCEPVTPPVVTPVEPPVVVTPPVIVTPPVVETASGVLVKGESFLKGDKLNVGMNAGGGIGTLYNAPAGIATDTHTGLYRLGFYQSPHDDVILQGRAVEGFNVFVNGVRYSSMVLNGYDKEIVGAFTAPNIWVGNVAGLEINQTATVTDRLRLDVRLKNTTAKSMTVRYMRNVDPDQSDLYNTTNLAVVGGVESKMQGKGGTFFLRDAAGKATIASTVINKAHVIGTALAPGKSVKGDYTMQLIYDTVTVPAGETVSLALEMGIK